MLDIMLIKNVNKKSGFIFSCFDELYFLTGPKLIMEHWNINTRYNLFD